MAEFVKAQIKGDKVVVFLKPSCPYCVLAKDVLSKYKFKSGHLELIDISGRSDMNSIQDYIKQITGARTVSTSNGVLNITLVIEDQTFSHYVTRSRLH